jgi:hypothetical protein
MARQQPQARRPAVDHDPRGLSFRHQLGKRATGQRAGILFRVKLDRGEAIGWSGDVGYAADSDRIVSSPRKEANGPVACQYRSRSKALWYAFVAKNKGDADLPSNRQPAGRAALTWPHQIESTVRYLGIEVDDALAIAEQVEV